MRTFFLLLVSIAPWIASSFADQPNVVLVITDDQGYANLSSMGHPILQTPHIDALYEKGVRLTDYHVDPTCAPTRAALMTGRYSDRAGVWHTVIGRHQLRTREVTLAEVFKKSGYATGVFGKWHLGDLYPFRPQDRGFDEIVIHAAGGVGQGPDFWGNDYFDDTYQTNDGWTTFEGFCTDVFFDESIDFMRRQAERKKPFFAYISTNAPHGPFYSPEKNYERFKEMEHDGKELGEVVGKYYGMIENIDDNMGKLMAFLGEEGLAENTLLIFTSDNGPVTRGIDIFNAGLREGKGTRWDGGHRVPWIMRWPKGGIEGGEDVDRVTAHIDILPTLAELCGLSLPDVELDGKSLVPLIENPDAEWETRRLVVESQRVYDPEKYRNFAVFTDGWRLVGKDELYDMEKDRGQKTDVAEEHPEILSDLQAAYEAFWADVSREHHLVTRPIVGAVASNPVVLQSHDWTTEGFWNQFHIARPFDQNDPPFGSWVMEVAETDWYQISIRRWAAEADRPIEDAYVGQSVGAHSARIEIQGQVLNQAVSKDAKEVTFRVRLEKGVAELKTTFFDKNEKPTTSAFYAYLLREDKEPVDGWQSREGLGLPVAEWPEQHGADPSAK